MVAIKHPVLKKQFEQFSKLASEEEKKAFWESFTQDFETLSETEQEKMREAWKENVANIDKQEIGSRLDKDVAAISVFPANAEEAKLIEALLSRMNVRYKVA